MRKLFLFIAIIAVLLLCFGENTKAAGGVPIEVLIDHYTDRVIAGNGIDDPEYELIVQEINERLANEAQAIANEHERTQWRAVAEVVQYSGIDGDKKKELVQNVLKYPLNSRMPPTAAITIAGLANWQYARRVFLRMIK